jgi:hypothetical protein
MIDDGKKARAAHLRRLADAEIAAHRDGEGFLGAALDGSLATGAVWPTSDLDFTIVPLTEAEEQDGVEWGQRDGIPWHKHLTGRQTLLDLVNGYPESFIRPVEGRFNLDATWLLDGLAVMEIVEDPEGMLEEVKAFVAARRFAPEVWEGRRAALLQELHRQRDAAADTLERGEWEEAYQTLSSPVGFGAVTAQLWLEAARRIYSNKEQDGLLADVTRAAEHPEVHALYRRLHAVEPERAAAVAPRLRDLGEQAASFYHGVDALALEEPRWRRGRVWAAWVRYITATLALAPAKGHPAHVYQRLGRIRYWTVDSPRRDLAELRQMKTPGLEPLESLAAATSRLADGVREELLGPASPDGRARASLTAAAQLLALTEQRLR